MEKNKPCWLKEWCPCKTAVCGTSKPDEGCPVYRYFQNLMNEDAEKYKLSIDLGIRYNCDTCGKQDCPYKPMLGWVRMNCVHWEDAK